ncbi:MAG: hypothetical protein WC605_11175 [Bacteroidales bacterium]
MLKRFTPTHATLFITFLSIFSLTCQLQAQKENPYHLVIVSEIAVYDSLVVVNPDNTLVDIEEFIPGIVPDIRYATKNNFIGRKVYESPKAFVSKPVAVLSMSL